MRLDRTKNSIKSIATGLLNRGVNVIFPFILRTIILQEFGVEYLGLNSLFASILQILNLSELGFGTVLVYNMYKPVASNDVRQVCALLKLYKIIYRIIGGLILGVGIMIMPFLPYLISGSYPSEINIYVLYIIYLSNTSISYLVFAYKGSLLAAHQRYDIDNNINSIILTILYLLQIGVVIMIKNYYLYVILLPISNITINIIRSKIVDLKYPQYKCEGNIDTQKKHDILKNTSAVFGHKLSSTITSSCDAIVISYFLGLSQLAIYTNYFYIINALNRILLTISSSLISGVGNSIELESVEKNHLDFKRIFFLYQWLASWCTICLLCLYQDFMYLWIGKLDEKYMLSINMVFMLCVYFYLLQIRRPILVYKDAKGLWWADRYKPYVGATINLITNICLVQVIGMIGVLISTIIESAIYLPWEANVVYRKYFQTPLKMYYQMILKSVSIMIIITGITYMICNGISVNGNYFMFFRKMMICVFIPNILLTIVYFRNKEFKYYLNKIFRNKS